MLSNAILFLCHYKHNGRFIFHRYDESILLGLETAVFFKPLRSTSCEIKFDAGKTTLSWLKMQRIYSIKFNKLFSYIDISTCTRQKLCGLWKWRYRTHSNVNHRESLTSWKGRSSSWARALIKCLQQCFSLGSLAFKTWRFQLESHWCKESVVRYFTFYFQVSRQCCKFSACVTHSNMTCYIFRSEL